ncbi:MAG: SpoIID/LytB domain-containing protein [Candidatus Marinimicrobia bacterium]|nr:SpoIID/LytB domain-containing protein [Candidatus Neomarinimicrobiota bacterium]MDD4960716.1 SpoIID/LytB domain-containing protein [Candidatus Neomarinimicrobiota bacterium]MDD5709743.1 SpoIID/LytB domain-containing protein [Candidatus Neomarinimicrobiota bacterium]
MKINRLMLCFFFLSGSFAALFAQIPEVRVLIMYSESSVEMQSDSRLNIFDQDNKREQLRGQQSLFLRREGETLALYDAGEKLIHRGNRLIIQNNDKNKDIRIKNVPQGIGWGREYKEDRTYKGSLEFFSNGSGDINVVNVLDLETYLYGVVPSEIGVNSPAEALKAQAICARTEAMVGLETGKYAGPDYQLTSDVMCQVYAGSGTANDAVRKAVDDTRGMVLTFRDTLISAYYASTCGGHTESIEFVWPERSGPTPYWKGHFDRPVGDSPDLTRADALRKWILDPPEVWCRPDSSTPDWMRNNFRWKTTITPEQISKMLAEQYRDIGNVYDIVPLERGVSGRIYDLLFIGDKGHFRVKGELNIRRLVSPPLRSSCFIVDKIGPVSAPASFIVSGAGSGHGVGMCQVGAIAMGRQNIPYTDILAHYFRGAVLRKKY